MRTKHRSLRLLAVGLLGALAACDTPDPTTAVVDNAYPQAVVYQAWWVTTLFTEPTAPAASSDALRVVPAEETAYALLAPGWDPASGEPPATLVPLRSKTKLSVSRGDVLHITVSDATFDGSCAAGQPLSQEDADFLTERIFPGPFTGLRYDAATCTVHPLGAADAGADAGDGG
jgi:hypothetical protein